jgi:glycosyltransferase involved in cell wall biosynthesis
VTPAATETPRLRIAFLCRPTSAGVWTPRSLDTGTGGSEEACIHVAEILGQRGHSVSVHMPDMVSGQRFGSVTYDNVDALKGEVIDVAIVWALPWLAALPEASTFRAGRTYLWLHTTKQSGYALEYSHLYHKIIVPSAYLRNHLHDLPDDRVLVFTNGIDPGQFDNSQQDRDPHLIAYGSDYSRGLETLLRCWPTLKKRVPDCRLNVFYGWQAQELRNPQYAQSLRVQFDPLLSQPDVSNLGRIGQLAVAEQYMRAGVWAYPSWSPETCCITGLKAQAGGAVPAVIPTAALKETVQFGFRTRRGYDDLPVPSSGAAETRHGWPISAADERELVSEWLTGLIDLLESPAQQSRIQQRMIPATKATYAWSAIIDKWDRELADTSNVTAGPPARPTASAQPTVGKTP